MILKFSHSNYNYLIFFEFELKMIIKNRNFFDEYEVLEEIGEGG